jgi:L-asparaginase II
VTYAGGDVLAEVIRSGFVEGFHRGSVAVLDQYGRLVAAVGDVHGPVFPRSSNKPMQTVGMLRAGLRLDDDADVAMASASHAGEPFHIARVTAMLAASGLTPADLRTPADLPLGEAARVALLRSGGDAAPIYMNCSGKHAAMLATCIAAGWPTDGYREPDHPLQVALRAVVEDVAGTKSAAVGIDGCGAPVLALPLAALAAAFLRLVTAPAGSPERRVADAMRAHPELVSGTAADDAKLMRAVPGLLAKGGAEGVLAVAGPGLGAVALKIDDGAMRARLPVLAAALRPLLDAATAGAVDALAEVPLLGGGRPVGAIRARRLW